MMPMSKEEAVQWVALKSMVSVKDARSIINHIWPIPDTPEPAPEYGDWIIWNAKPDSVCPPDAVGKMGQVQLVCETRGQAQAGGNYAFDRAIWNTSVSETSRVSAYRIRQTPARGETIVLYGFRDVGMGWVFTNIRADCAKYRITLEADASGAPKDRGIQRVEVL